MLIVKKSLNRTGRISSFLRTGFTSNLFEQIQVQHVFKRTMLLEASKTNAIYRYPKEMAREIIEENYGSYEKEHITDEMMLILFKKKLYEKILKDRVVLILHLCSRCDIKILKLKALCNTIGLGAVFPTLEILREVLNNYEETPGLKLVKHLIYRKTLLLHADLDQSELSLGIKELMKVLDNKPDLILLGAISDNMVYTREDIIHMSTLNTMPEQYAEAFQLINSPVREIISNTSNSLHVLTNILNAHISKLK